MDLNEIMRKQEEFDEKHKSKFDWDVKITKKNPEMLTFLLTSLMGELGETANIVKKIARGDNEIDDEMDNLEEEITDTFIYLIKICNQLNINLEENYLKMLEENKKRFKKYEK